METYFFPRNGNKAYLFRRPKSPFNRKIIMSIVEDGHVGIVIGLVLAIKRLLEETPVNTECVIGNCILLYAVLGFRIGFHWFNFVAMSLISTLAYFACLRPLEFANSITDGPEMTQKLQQSLDFGRTMITNGIQESSNIMTQVFAQYQNALPGQL